jgi:Protein of unknown function (DUF2510)
MQWGLHEWGWIVLLVLLVALGITAVGLFVLLRRAQAPSDERGPRPGVGVRHGGGFVPLSIDGAHALVGQSLAAATVARLGRSRRDRVRGFTPISPRGCGSIVTVWLAPIEGGTAYTIESRPALPVAWLDGRRNQRIVDLVTRELDGAAITSPAAAWAPDPFHRHELRYWDGLSWTESVSDHGRTTIDPMTVSTN